MFAADGWGISASTKGGTVARRQETYQRPTDSRREEAASAIVGAAALPPLVGLRAALVGHRWRVSRRLAGAAALLAAAVQASETAPWVVVAICLTELIDARARAVVTPSLGELARSLERCRRRGDAASLLVIDMAADDDALRKLLSSTRITDSVVVSRGRSRFEVYGLFEGGEIPRARLEARFGEVLRGADGIFRWAGYPMDGLTLDALLARARRSSTAEAVRAIGPRAPKLSQTSVNPSAGLELPEPQRAASS